MYQQYFGFKAMPFTANIDANQYYLGRLQRQIITLVHNGFKLGRGLVVITGCTGVGKTMFVKFFIQEQLNSRFTIATISAEKNEDLGLLYLILTGFKQQIIDYKTSSLIKQVEFFIQYQIRSNHSPLLIIDNAHNLSDKNLQLLTRLTNFEKDGKLYFQVLLIGGEKLSNKLESEVNKALKNNIVSIGKIDSMRSDETKEYVLHHLRRVGWIDNPAIPDNVILQAQQETGGNPAKVNDYFDRFLRQQMIKLPDSNNSQSNNKQQYNSVNLLNVLMDIRDENKEKEKNSKSKKTRSKSKFKHKPIGHHDSKAGRKKKLMAKNLGLNWNTVSVIVGSYLMSAVVAGMFLYFENIQSYENQEQAMFARK